MSAASAMALEQQGGMDLGALTPQQLQQLGQQLQADLQTLSESAQKLQGAVSRFHQSGVALEAFGEQQPGTPMLVPLTKSLYAPGKLGATDSVLVDVGTGYFIEYSPSGGVDYCKRKLLMLRENLDKLGEIMAVKRRQLMQVQEELQRKVQQLQQMQGRAT